MPHRGRQPGRSSSIRTSRCGTGPEIWPGPSMLRLTSADLYVRARSPRRDHDDDSVTTADRADPAFARHFLRHRLDVGIVTGKAADDGSDAPRLAPWHVGGSVRPATSPIHLGGCVAQPFRVIAHEAKPVEPDPDGHRRCGRTLSRSPRADPCCTDGARVVRCRARWAVRAAVRGQLAGCSDSSSRWTVSSPSATSIRRRLWGCRLPSSSMRESRLSTSRWIVRRSGRAPYSGW